jgi:hypothetical protein
VRTDWLLDKGQLSVNVGSVYDATAEHVFVPVFTLISGKQVIVGASKSLIVTLNEQVFVLPTASVALHITVLIPLSNVALLFGEPCTTPVPPLTGATVALGVQLSFTFGVG